MASNCCSPAADHTSVCAAFARPRASNTAPEKPTAKPSTRHGPGFCSSHPHATTAHRQFSYVEPTQGGILLEHGDTPRKYTVYAIGTDGRMIVGDVTV